MRACMRCIANQAYLRAPSLRLALIAFPMRDIAQREGARAECTRVHVLVIAMRSIGVAYISL
jgi:hypothetical protein